MCEASRKISNILQQGSQAIYNELQTKGNLTIFDARDVLKEKLDSSLPQDVKTKDLLKSVEKKHSDADFDPLGMTLRLT